MIRAAIFDMDGLMFDTERLSTMGWLKAAKEKGYPLTEEFIISFKGTNVSSSRKLFKETFGDTVDYDIARSIRTAFIHEYMEEHGVPVKAGLFTLLEALKARGIKAAVATSTSREFAERYLKMAGVYEYYDAFIFGDQVQNGKPDPEIFLKAAASLSIPINDCMVLEDSPAGIAAAKAAGAVIAVIPDQIPLSEDHKEGVSVFSDLSKVCGLL